MKSSALGIRKKVCILTFLFLYSGIITIIIFRNLLDKAINPLQRCITGDGPWIMGGIFIFLIMVGFAAWKSIGLLGQDVNHGSSSDGEGFPVEAPDSSKAAGEPERECSNSCGMGQELDRDLLFEFIRDGCLEIVDLHISKCNNLDIRSDDGDTLVHFVIMHGNKEMIALVLSKGPNVNERNCDGETPLHILSRDGNNELVKLLASCYADVNARNNAGATPLHLSVRNDNLETAQLLVDKGANISSRDIAGNTPLHYAALSGNRETLNMLISKGACLSARNKDDKTPLDLARENNHIDIIGLLRIY